MKQIQIYSPVKGPTGYELLARDLIEELDKQGVHICLEEFKNWGPFEVILSQKNHDILSRALKNNPYPQPTPITNLNICLPEQVKLRDDMRNVNFTMFEADSIPKNWADVLHNIDEIIVPTDFNRWSFSHTSGTPVEKIKVLPLGYNQERYNNEVVPLPLEHEGKCILDFPIRFLVVCEITERKNFWGTMQTFYTVAGRYGADKVCLIIKASNYSKIVNLRQEMEDFKKRLIDEKVIDDVPYNIFWYPPLLPEETHPNFIAIGTHYLTTSFGEGWDLTAMQAAACGLHLYVPMHSAYQCWLDSNSVSFLPVAKKLEASQAPPTGRLYENSHWYAYHMQDSIEIIVDSLKDPSIVEKKKERMKEMIQRYQWNNLIDSYMEALHL